MPGTDLRRLPQPWWVGPAVPLVVLVGFAYFVWPTPWREVAWASLGAKTTPIGRQHVITGRIQVRVGDAWEDMSSP